LLEEEERIIYLADSKVFGNLGAECPGERCEMAPRFPDTFESAKYLSVLESFKPPRVSAFSLAFACLVVLLCAREGVVGAVSWLSTAGCEFR